MFLFVSTYAFANENSQFYNESILYVREIQNCILVQTRSGISKKDVSLYEIL